MSTEQHARRLRPVTRRFVMAQLALAAVAPRLARAQDRSRRHVIGVISGNAQPSEEALARHPMLRALAELGYVQGRNLAIEWRYANGDFARLPSLVEELLRLGAEVLVASGGLAAITAAHATSERPVVIFAAGDPLGMGLVASLAHPEGNVTGLSEASTEVSSKRVDLLRQFIPGARRIAILWNANDPGMVLRARAIEGAAQPVGLAIEAYGLHAVADIEPALAAIAQRAPDAMLIVSDPLTSLSLRRFIEFAATRRIPAMYEYAEHVRGGGLVAYGPSLPDQQVRAGQFVARLLDGARPADLPMEQPTRFYLTINLRAARALEIAVPPMLLALADEVIE
jgi:putative ABC transport system substrate-binding protein